MNIKQSQTNNYNLSQRYNGEDVMFLLWMLPMNAMNLQNYFLQKFISR